MPRASRALVEALGKAEFRQHDLANLPDLGILADGVWGSFVAAYFSDLPVALEGWNRALGAGGWIALTEVDDLCLERSGFSVSKELILGDEELSFTGPARKDVVDAWEANSIA